MHSHLVAVEVCVKCSTDKRVQVDGLTFNQHRLKCLNTMTVESRRTVEKDPALNRRFQQVLIREPDLELSLEILRGLKERYELHHGVTITDEALQTANRLADRYISDRCLPDKAIDLIDGAAAQLKIEVTSKPQVVEEAWQHRAPTHRQEL